VFNIGPEELILVLVIALIIFGPKRLPEIGRTIGKALGEFRRASSGIRDEIERGLNLDQDDPPVASSSGGEPIEEPSGPEVNGDQPHREEGDGAQAGTSTAEGSA
jgi:sec-independent protein translocase protein TatA